MSQKFRIRGVVAVAMVAAMVAAVAPSAMADAPDVAKAIAVAKTGSSGRDLVGREVKGHGVTVSPAKSKDGKSLRTLVQDAPGGVAALAVLEEGQSSAVVHGLLPAGSKVTAAQGGEYQALTPEGTRLTVKAPWARDAAGKSLPTSYTFAAGQITQSVDTTGATFPVVADPTITMTGTLARGTRFHFNRVETMRIAGIAGKAADTCNLLNGVLGMVTDCKDPGWRAQIPASVDAAARMPGQCLFVEMGPNSSILYFSSGSEAC